MSARHSMQCGTAPCWSLVLWKPSCILSTMWGKFFYIKPLFQASWFQMQCRDRWDKKGNSFWQRECDLQKWEEKVVLEKQLWLKCSHSLGSAWKQQKIINKQGKGKQVFMLLIEKQEGCFKSLEEWFKSVAHVVQMSTKESVQENNILGTWCQNSNSRKGEEGCAWFSLISWAHGYWTHSSSERPHQGGLTAEEEEQASWKGAKAKDTSAKGLAGCRRQCMCSHNAIMK